MGAYCASLVTCIDVFSLISFVRCLRHSVVSPYGVGTKCILALIHCKRILCLREGAGRKGMPARTPRSLPRCTAAVCFYRWSDWLLTAVATTRLSSLQAAALYKPPMQNPTWRIARQDTDCWAIFKPTDAPAKQKFVRHDINAPLHTGMVIPTKR